MAQGASSSGILATGYGGLGVSIPPTTAGNVIFTTDGSVWSSAPNIVRGTAVTLTTQTSVDFTSIPSWVKRITIMLNGVSTNGSSYVQVQIGNTTVTTTGYSSSSQQTGQASGFVASSSGFIFGGGSPSITRSGAMILTNLSGNIWVETHNIYGFIPSNNEYQMTGAGVLSLASVLNIVRITNFNGTDTFDAGSVNILYE